MAGTFALVLGTTVGLVAAYYGGRIEALIMRIIDLQLSLPAILLALVLVAMLGQGLMQLVAALVAGAIRLFRPHDPWRGERRAAQGLHRGGALDAASGSPRAVPPSPAQCAAAADRGGDRAGGEFHRA